MIVLDANILLYAYDAVPVQHAKARAWVENVFSGIEPVGLPWQTLAAFLRIMTDLGLPGKRFSGAEAADFVSQWLGLPNVRVLTPGDEHWRIFQKMIVEGQATGPLVSDAQLAALTIEYGGVLYTADRDFARFPGLRWENPLG